MFRTSAILALGLLAPTYVGASPRYDSEAIARAQLETARQIRRDAALIVAVAPRQLVPEDAGAAPFAKQNWTVKGTVTRCFKGRMAAPATVSYIITAEGRPNALAHPHVAFLRRWNGGWAAVDGPMFRDSPSFRSGLARITPRCVK